MGKKCFRWSISSFKLSLSKSFHRPIELYLNERNDEYVEEEDTFFSSLLNVYFSFYTPLKLFENKIIENHNDCWLLFAAAAVLMKVNFFG